MGVVAVGMEGVEMDVVDSLQVITLYWSYV